MSISSVAGMHHPWRAFGALVDWTLHFAALPAGLTAQTFYDSREVVMAPDLDQVERRCTIEHERQHVLDPDATEDVVRRRTARVLLPDVRQLGEALAWAYDLDEAADELWVDLDVLLDRLEALHPAERHYLRRRLADEQDDQQEDVA